MTILVTGCCGFIGSHLTEKFLKEGLVVWGIDNFTDNYDQNFKRENLQILKKHSNFRFREEDLLESNIVTEIKPTEVYHLASIPGVRKSLEIPCFYVRNNIEVFVKLLEDCRKIGIQKFVYASSSSVYGNNEKTPFNESDKVESLQSSYACSKRCLEIYAKYYYDVFKLPVIGLRFFTVYGERGRPDMAPYIFLKSISKGETIFQYGDGSSYRDYTYISDIVDGIYNIHLGRGVWGEIYNLGNNSPISLSDFINVCEEVVGSNANIEIKNKQLGDVERTYADLTKSIIELRFYPKIQLKEGLKRMYAWMIENKRI